MLIVNRNIFSSCVATYEAVLTGRHLVVVGSRAVAEHVLHLQKLVSAVASDDGESKALGALLQRRVVHLTLQLAGIRSETRHTSLACEPGAHVSMCLILYQFQKFVNNFPLYVLSYIYMNPVELLLLILFMFLLLLLF